MNKIKLSKIILIIAIYSVAFTLLFMSIKSYQTYLNTYKNCKSASNTNISSTKKIKNTNCININKFSTTVFNNETLQKNPYKTLSQSNPKIQKNIAGHVLRLHVIAVTMTRNLKLKFATASSLNFKLVFRAYLRRHRQSNMSPPNLKILNNPPIILFTKTAILIQQKFLYKTDIFPQKHMVTSHSRQDIMMHYVLK